MQALSERLRTSEPAAPDDLALLGAWLLECNAALGDALQALVRMGLTATARLKTSGTIIDKMRRQRGLDLLSIQDLAGARVVRRMTLDEQTELAAQIQAIWPGSRLIDRRADPRYGYRALHIVPRVNGRPIEIQLRTKYQDIWAQVMETMGDLWGRAIRYGGEPSDPDATYGLESDDDAARFVALSERMGLPAGIITTMRAERGPITRRDVVRTWITTGDLLHELADLENQLARLRSGDPGNRVVQIDSLEARIKAISRPIVDAAELFVREAKQQDIN